MKRYLPLAALLCAGVFASSLDAATITINADPEGHEVRSDSSTGNSEDRATSLLGRVHGGRLHRPLSEFDLSVIPDGATINSVVFEFDVTGNDANSTNYDDGTSDLDVSELITDPDKLNGWNWYNQSFGVDMTGNTADDVPFGTAGGDLGPVLATVADSTYDPNTINAGDTITFASTAGLVAAVQNNLGDDLLYLMTVNNAETGPDRSFLRVAESGEPSFRITVDYTAPIPEPSTSLLLFAGAAAVAVCRRG